MTEDTTTTTTTEAEQPDVDELIRMLRTKIAALSGENAQLRDQLLDARITAGQITLKGE